MTSNFSNAFLAHFSHTFRALTKTDKDKLAERHEGSQSTVGSRTGFFDAEKMSGSSGT